MNKLIEWVEIPTADFARAVQFYNSVFQLQMEALDFGHEKMESFPIGEGELFFNGFYLKELKFYEGLEVFFKISVTTFS
jgi:predicted enzyme related to lactoylglutathione lyase